MKPYTKTYLAYFNYGTEDFIPCEVCGRKAVDIAHIVARSKFGSKRKDEQDDISNLAAMCRGCHYDYDFDNRWSVEEIQAVHNSFMKRRLVHE
jgi:hypothetical protein